MTRPVRSAIALAAVALAAVATLSGCRGLLGIDPGDHEPPDAAPDAVTCERTGRQCLGEDALRTCAAVGQAPLDEPCGWGCSEVGAPHCAQLLPSGGAVQSTDLEPDAALAAVVIAEPVQVNTDDGSIGSLRAAGTGVISGIGYEVRSGVALFSFGSLEVRAAISVVGLRPLAVISHGDVAIRAILDLRGTCQGLAAGPGGWPGGLAQTAAPEACGGGGGAAETATAGGGGGSFGTRGGTGGSISPGSAPPGMPGAVAGDPLIPVLRGGCGGGGGGGGPTAGVGGGGGGAIQIASDGTLLFDGGGINAGGCGGKPGPATRSGGGGGAGGAILLEAPVVRLSDSARIAANGGGGSGGAAGGAGTAGLASAMAAPGGNPGPIGGAAGGPGAAQGALVGGNGVVGTHSGGAGGGAGRIRIRTRRGAIEAAAGAVLSPALGEAGTTTTQAAASVQ